MSQWRELRDCPDCKAHKGFSCREPGCPQRQEANPQDELDRLPFWPLNTMFPPDDGAA